MRIEPNDSPTELTYLDLINGLKTDISSDKIMPETVKRKLLDRLDSIGRIIEPYSG